MESPTWSAVCTASAEALPAARWRRCSSDRKPRSISRTFGEVAREYLDRPSIRSLREVRQRAEEGSDQAHFPGQRAASSRDLFSLVHAFEGSHQSENLWRREKVPLQGMVWLGPPAILRTSGDPHVDKLTGKVCAPDQSVLPKDLKRRGAW